jgi:UDP-N-acetylmuramoyl-tripeptide--D-alanyl-D-alanine ligase
MREMQVFNLAYILTGIQSGDARRGDGLAGPCGHCSFSQVVFDSRDVVQDALFVALAGERTDGHHFLPDVAKRGGRGALVRREELSQRKPALEDFPRPWVVVDTEQGETSGGEAGGGASGRGEHEGEANDRFFFIAVDDPQAALWRLAAFHRSRFSLDMVGVTGSVGKTSTKECISAMLSQHAHTLKSERSYNTGISIPTTLLNLTTEHRAAVIELGMWAQGEIRELARLVRPNIGVVTNVGLSHLERMGSIEAIAEAKAELVEAIPPDGVAVLNGDDERVNAMARRTSARVVRYGVYADTLDVRAERIESYGLQGIGFRLHYRGETVAVRSPLVGHHNVYTVLAAASVGLVLGVPCQHIIAGLQEDLPYARLRVVQGKAEGGTFTIIDDSYNASPASMLAALNVLDECSGRHIAVLGDMQELGGLAEESHRVVGKHAALVADVLVCVGSNARWIAEEARYRLPDTHAVKEGDDAIALVRSLVRPGDVVLVKGSRGLAMERVVDALAWSGGGEAGGRRREKED